MELLSRARVLSQPGANTGRRTVQLPRFAVAKLRLVVVATVFPETDGRVHTEVADLLDRTVAKSGE